MQLIKIKGIINTSKFQEFVTSNLVDIAYFEEAIGDTITLFVESDIDLSSEDDREWMTELIKEGLMECQELSAKIAW